MSEDMKDNEALYRQVFNKEQGTTKYYPVVKWSDVKELLEKPKKPEPVKYNKWRIGWSNDKQCFIASRDSNASFSGNAIRVIELPLKENVRMALREKRDNDGYTLTVSDTLMALEALGMIAEEQE